MDLWSVYYTAKNEKKLRTQMCPQLSHPLKMNRFSSVYVKQHADPIQPLQTPVQLR